jgi:hypothetical protein
MRRDECVGDAASVPGPPQDVQRLVRVVVPKGHQDQIFKTSVTI